MGKPKFPRCANCWILFSKEYCKTLRKFTNIKQNEAIREASIKWKSMSNIEKQSWRELSRQKKVLKQIKHLNYDRFIMEDPSPSKTSQIKKVENKEMKDLNNDNPSGVTPEWFSDYIDLKMCS